jgi:hypothetical protein
MTGEHLILSVYENTKEPELPYVKLKGMATGRAPSTAGKQRGLVSSIRTEIANIIPKFTRSSSASSINTLRKRV